ncbi:hypothetical protein TNCV_4110811 [Trichonephila clavipes]|nr:hypothetical protein TNCV_4110811 [Trichonephila clavipes]
MLDHLKDNIRRAIADIRPQMLEKLKSDDTVEDSDWDDPAVEYSFKHEQNLRIYAAKFSKNTNFFLTKNDASKEHWPVRHLPVVGGEENVEHMLRLCSNFEREGNILRLVFKTLNINWSPSLQ